MSRLILYMIFGTIYLFAGVLGFYAVHEAMHGKIMAEYGCEKVRYGIDWKAPYTICDDKNFTETNEQRLLHLEVDTDNVTLLPMLITIYLLLFVIGSLLVEKKKDDTQ